MKNVPSHWSKASAAAGTLTNFECSLAYFARAPAGGHPEGDISPCPLLISSCLPTDRPDAGIANDEFPSFCQCHGMGHSLVTRIFSRVICGENVGGNFYIHLYYLFKYIFYNIMIYNKSMYKIFLITS